MQIPSRRTRRLLRWTIAALWFLSLYQINGQDSEPTTEEATPAEGSQNTSDTTARTPVIGDPSATGLDYLFNRKAQDGSTAEHATDAGLRLRDKGIAADALDGQIEDPALRSRFEKYLGTKEVTEERLASYDTIYDQVLLDLREDQTTQAWQKLLQLAEYQYIDAGVSWELAGRIESIWNAGQTSGEVANANERLRGEIKGANRNADFMSERIRENEIEYQRRMRASGGDQNSNNTAQTNVQGGDVNTPPVGNVMGKLQLTEEYLRGLELKAKVKMNELKMEKLFEQAKADFADYVTTLFNSGRYRHAILGADFWRRIFDQGEYPVSMAQQVNASLEVAREVQSTVDVFHYKLEQDQVAEATDRLQEAFVLDEHHPAMLAVERSKKERVQEFTSRLGKMRNMIEARDFTNLQQVLDEMKQVAPDFDATKPMAIVNAVKLESRMRLGKAKLAAQQGDLQTAMQEFQAAAKAWPGNPELEDSASKFFEGQDVKNQSVDEFDRLVEAGDYRQIYEKQLAFAPAIKDDQDRQEQLKSALQKMKLAETAIEKANLMRANGDVFGAWETVEFAVTELPEDLKLNALRGELAGKGAEFVAAVNKAKGAEAKGDLGFSLTWYAIAQRQYPASQIANEGIDRLSAHILGDQIDPDNKQVIDKRQIETDDAKK